MSEVALLSISLLQRMKELEEEIVKLTVMENEEVDNQMRDIENDGGRGSALVASLRGDGYDPAAVVRTAIRYAVNLKVQELTEVNHKLTEIKARYPYVHVVF